MKKITDFPMYLQIFFAVTGAIFMVVFFTIIIWFWLDGNQRHLSAMATFSSMMEENLPPASAAIPVQSAAIDDWMKRTKTRFALFNANGQLLSRPLTPPLPYPQRIVPGGNFDDRYETRFVWLLQDKRVLVLQFSTDRAKRPWFFILLLLVLACAVALVSFPVIRRLTARLESLQNSVVSLGKGNLASRVAVSGNDEVGQLAASFNRSAAQIEALVYAHKNMLANASHELRSPLARIQMASTLLAAEDSPARREMQRSVAELNELVEEILTMSRLEMASADSKDFCYSDITAIAAEECASAEVSLTARHILGWVNPRLLRRLMRNLIDNALRHGGGEVTVSLRGGSADYFLFQVCDRGVGIPETELERIFTPFYRLNPGQSGTGLGLALVKSIAVYHGGSAWSYNRRAGGAGFCVRIPLVAAQ
ncbi:ATP-binding protein [Pantoea sp. B65]|uniref:HAMP domain-containing sensor histidine kinase n=1 Tax=Pantoea sp. B65 TaxID=2813359 RepID=UPI0039B3B062